MKLYPQEIPYPFCQSNISEKNEKKIEARSALPPHQSKKQEDNSLNSLLLFLTVLDLLEQEKRP